MDEGFDFIQSLNIVSYSYLKTVCMSCDAIIHVFGYLSMEYEMILGLGLVYLDLLLGDIG